MPGHALRSPAVARPDDGPKTHEPRRPALLLIREHAATYGAPSMVTPGIMAPVVDPTAGRTEAPLGADALPDALPDPFEDVDALEELGDEIATLAAGGRARAPGRAGDSGGVRRWERVCWRWRRRRRRGGPRGRP